MGILCTFNLRPVSRGLEHNKSFMEDMLIQEATMPNDKLMYFYLFYIK